MKNTAVVIIITIVVVLIIFGILYGAFRKKEELTQEEINALNRIKSITPPSTVPANPIAKEYFSKLWHDHVRLTRDVMVATFNNDPNLNNLVDSLLKNQEDMGNAIDKYYPSSAPIITQVLKEHITQAKDILDDLKYKRLGRLSSDINRWYANADKFSEIMMTINPAWNLKSHMQEHLRVLERQSIYEWIGAKKLSLDIYNDRVIPNAQTMADHIAAGLPS